MNADSLLATAGRSRACLPRVSRNSCCRAAPQAISMVTSGSTGSCGAWAATSTSAGREQTRKDGNKPRVTGGICSVPHHTYPKGRGHKSVCARQGPLPCSLPSAHLDLTLASLGGAGTQEPSLHSAEHLWGSCALSLRPPPLPLPQALSSTSPSTLSSQRAPPPIGNLAGLSTRTLSLLSLPTWNLVLMSVSWPEGDDGHVSPLSWLSRLFVPTQGSAVVLAT